jgi:prepilin-type N-terminal cleavage/methylation domain-containing protein
MHKSGFTLIELLIAIAIMAIMAGAIAPYLQFTPPGYERNQFITRLNSLVRLAWQQSVITNKVHRIVFDIKHRKIRVEKDISTNIQAKKQHFEPLRKMMLDSDIVIPRSIEIKQFFIEGVDEMKRSGSTTLIWFYIIPDGMTQQVTINCIDKEDPHIKPLQFGLVLNPFTAQFKVYHEFVR